MATLAIVTLLRLHGRRIVFRRARLWRPMRETMASKPPAVQLNLFEPLPEPRRIPTATTPARANFAYPEDSHAPDLSRRTQPTRRLDRIYYPEEPGNYGDPVPPQRIQPGPVSLPARETRYPRKTA